MEVAQLGSTDLRIARVGLGGWAFGGAGWWEYGWSGQSDDDSIAVIERAISLGINWIDTAAGYGFGRSEELIGRALMGCKSKPYLITKCSVVEGPNHTVAHSLKRESIRREVSSSLARLRVDQIDLYLLHEPVPVEDIEEGWRALVELKDEGVVRYIGVSNFSVAQMRQISSIAPIDVIQPGYSLIDRSAEAEVLPFARSEGIGVIVYSPLASGLLAGHMTRARARSLPADDWRSGSPEFRPPRLSRNLKIARRVSEVAGEIGASSAQVALAWTLCNRAVGGAIVGCRRPAHVDAIVASVELASNADTAAALNRLTSSVGDDGT